MKKCISTIILVIIVLLPEARSQGTFSFQTIVRNTQGNPIGNHAVGIRIQIIQQSIFGLPVYVETHAVRTGAEGLVRIVIGSGTAVVGQISGINWSDGPYFLKIETDPSGGTNFTLTTVSEILTVPVVKFAKTTGNGFSGSFTDLSDRPDVANWDQNMSNDFNGSYTNLNGKPLLPSINDATTSASAVWSSSKTAASQSTKANASDLYTKTNLQTAGQASVNYVNLTSRPANLDEDKSDDLLIGGDQSVNGDKVFTNNIQAKAGFSNFMNELYKVATPVSPGDAVPKSYADGLKIRLETLESLNNGIVKDYDGNLYTTVKIGEQVWMAENLRTTHTVSGASYQFTYPNDDPDNVDQYGLLYYAWIMSDDLCPAGMHIPTDIEWKQLEQYLGMSQAAADSFLCRGTDEAKELKINGSTGLNLQFAGRYWHDTGSEAFSGFGIEADYWCKGQILLPGPNPDAFVNRSFSISTDKICRKTSAVIAHDYYFGSIRCIKD